MTCLYQLCRPGQLIRSSGKITSLSVTPASKEENSPQSATVTFEKETLVYHL